MLIVFLVEELDYFLLLEFTKKLVNKDIMADFSVFGGLTISSEITFYSPGL